MRILGVYFILVSVLTIFFNLAAVSANEQMWREHPFATIFSLGAKLHKNCYTFSPPYTGFEVFIFVLLIAGILLVVLGGKKKNINSN